MKYYKLRYDPNSKTDLASHATLLEGKSLRQLYTISEEKADGKGRIGQLVEELHFDYAPNSVAEADFEKAGVELKTTGLMRLKNGSFKAKERLVLGIIDYDSIITEQFIQSKFYKKNNNLLLVFYEYIRGVLPVDMPFILSSLWSLPEKDFEVIYRDWKVIQNYVVDGNAHLLSESLTFVLSPCTKGTTAKKSFRRQPNSPIKAKQRAYSFKASYVTTIYEDCLSGRKNENTRDSRKGLFSPEDIRLKGIQGCLDDAVMAHLGMPAIHFLNQKNHSKSKQRLASATNELLKLSFDQNRKDFRKYGIEVKTVKVEENGTVRESMSFPAFRYTELVAEEFEDTQTFEILSNTFLFVFWRKSGADYVLSKHTLWSASLKDIDEMKGAYKRVQEIVSRGEIVKSVNNKGIRKTNFPNSKESYFCHVRPHAQNTQDTYELPQPDRVTGTLEYTKHSFWINSSFIQSIYLS